MSNVEVKDCCLCTDVDEKMPHFYPKHGPLPSSQYKNEGQSEDQETPGPHLSVVNG